MTYATAEQWAELLLAVETPLADVWPPRQLVHTLRSVDDKQLVAEDRAPLVLREHPAPLNMDAFDTGLCSTSYGTVYGPGLAGFSPPPRSDYRVL